MYFQLSQVKRLALTLVSTGGLILLVNAKGNSMAGYNYLNLTPASATGWTAIDTGQIYDQQTIYDYMDGAGEIYKQYRFVELFVRNYAKPDEPGIVVEIYRMADAADAFGIYSHIRSGRSLTLGQGGDESNGIISFWQGRLYVYLHTEKETDLVHQTMIKIATVVAQHIHENGDRPPILKLLPPANLVTHEVRFLRSYILLNQHYFISTENILQIDEETEAVLAPYLLDQGKCFLLLLCYPSPDKAAAAEVSFKQNYFPEAPAAAFVKTENGRWTGVTRKDNFLVIVFDADSQDHLHQLQVQVIIP